MNENINIDDENNNEKLECNNDLHNLDIDNISVLDRLLLKGYVNEELKKSLLILKDLKKVLMFLENLIMIMI